MQLDLERRGSQWKRIIDLYLPAFADAAIRFLVIGADAFILGIFDIIMMNQVSAYRLLWWVILVFFGRAVVVLQVYMMESRAKRERGKVKKIFLQGVAFAVCFWAVSFLGWQWGRGWLLQYGAIYGIDYLDVVFQYGLVSYIYSLFRVYFFSAKKLKAFVITTVVGFFINIALNFIFIIHYQFLLLSSPASAVAMATIVTEGLMVLALLGLWPDNWFLTEKGKASGLSWHDLSVMLSKAVTYGAVFLVFLSRRVAVDFWALSDTIIYQSTYFIQAQFLILALMFSIAGGEALLILYGDRSNLKTQSSLFWKVTFLSVGLIVLFFLIVLLSKGWWIKVLAIEQGALSEITKLLTGALLLAMVVNILRAFIASCEAKILQEKKVVYLLLTAIIGVVGQFGATYVIYNFMGHVKMWSILVGEVISTQLQLVLLVYFFMRLSKVDKEG